MIGYYVSGQLKSITYKMSNFFGGSGGEAYGFKKANAEYKGIKGHFENLIGFDVDPYCCIDYQRLTGGKVAQMDFFSRQQYIDFHGHEPPDDWREVTPEDILRASNGEVPDGVFLSPPCKGFSGLLPESVAATPKYQALNALTERGIMLSLAAYEHDLPAFYLIENVPRIETRGAKFLIEIEALLKSHGYLVQRSVHDAGEIGFLGQTRKRFLLIARNPKKLSNFIYEPYKYGLRSIGNVLENIPMPGEERCGRMHVMPKLQWSTWVRLARIPAGGDWRSLKEEFGHAPWAGSHKIIPWDGCANTITSATRGIGQSSGASACADPRLDKVQGYGNKFRVISSDEPCTTITGSRLGSGLQIFADTKIPQYANLYRVVREDETCPTVVGGIAPSNGALCIADSRSFKIATSDKWSGAGNYGVIDWNNPSPTVTASSDIHSGTAAVADPRIPSAKDKGVYVIIAEDGTWHRPLSILERALLQGFPLTFDDGSPLEFAGSSQSIWIEHIGNAVPPPSAQELGETVLRALLPNHVGDFVLGDTPIWVMPKTSETPVYSM